MFTTGNIGQGVKNVTCKAHPRAHTKVTDHKHLGTTSHCLNTRGAAAVITLQIKEVGRGCVILFTNIEIIIESCGFWGQNGYKLDLSSSNFK